MFRSTGLTLIGWLAVSVPLIAAQSCPPEPRAFLSAVMGFSTAEIQQAEQGAAIARTLPSQKHEIATMGLVLIGAPRKYYVERFREIEKLKKGENVLQVRKFSSPPQVEDLRDLDLSPQEIHELQRCRAGQCSFKLPAGMMAHIQRQVDWPAPDAQAQAASVFRQALVGYVQSYLAAGNNAMMTYEDKGHPVATREEFLRLLGEAPYVAACAPRFGEYLRNFPEAPPPLAEDFIYWSKETYSHDLKPVLTVTHVSIYQPTENVTPADVNDPVYAPPFVLASKQIFAMHYYESSLGLTLLLDARVNGGGPAFYMVYVNRSTIDLLRKWYSGLARGKAAGNVRQSMKHNLLQLKKKIEELYAGD